jgi:hypothetical protein
MAEIHVIGGGDEERDKLAAYFDDLAAQTRDGKILGHSAILVRPGGNWTVTGCSGGDLAREIGMHFLCMLDLARHMEK